MKKISINLDELVGRHTHMSVKQYMFVMRLATLERHGSMQKILDGFFPKKWEKENEKLAEMMKKLGYEDWQFLPPKVQKRMGIKAKEGARQGRRKIAPMKS